MMGAKHALPDAPRSGQPRKYNQKEQAEIIALTCSGLPEGRKRWTLELLAEKAKTIEGLETINRESIRLILKKNKCNPWLRKMWCITTITRSYRRRMYHLLDLYEESYDPDLPVVCFDEKSKQLGEEVHTPIPMKPGSRGKYDYEYRRGGTRNIFVAVEPKAGKWHYKGDKDTQKA